MKKISFSNIKDVLSREEMKMIMAGSGTGNAPLCHYQCHVEDQYQDVDNCDRATIEGKCGVVGDAKCYCDPA